MRATFRADATSFADSARPATMRKPRVATNSSEQKYKFALEFLGRSTPGMTQRRCESRQTAATLVDTAADWTSGIVRIRSSAVA